MWGPMTCHSLMVGGVRVNGVGGRVWVCFYADVGHYRVDIAKHGLSRLVRWIRHCDDGADWAGLG
jgi:hypothetical protein